MYLCNIIHSCVQMRASIIRHVSNIYVHTMKPLYILQFVTVMIFYLQMAGLDW